MHYDHSPEPSDLGQYQDHEIALMAQHTKGLERAALTEVLILRAKLKKRRDAEKTVKKTV